MSDERARLKKVAIAWKNAGPALVAARRADIRRDNNVLAMEALNSLFRETLKKSRPRKTSGFVEMYRIFKRHYKP